MSLSRQWIQTLSWISLYANSSKILLKNLCSTLMKPRKDFQPIVEKKDYYSAVLLIVIYPSQSRLCTYWRRSLLKGHLGNPANEESSNHKFSANEA